MNQGNSLRHPPEIPLRDDLLDLLRQWQKKHKDSRWLFPTKHGQPDGHMLRRLKDIAKRAELPGKWTLHKFRKTCATRWERNGFRVRDIQVLLGHESLTTTEKYLGLSGHDDLRRKMNSGD